ncbi:AhpC/TSA family protein [Aurantibacter crassamenti]|uniref:TlpA disulfide reductase family protein n=1 Tax=Aurantibacter crassamenti TaxID=1837375 RepID=UPI0019398DBC|nr:TlpA disulfide reductase family protein [Aurantibacter crassamenti]MBM1107232.1 AhpC/TSA family protein [Aurantibacter crassamenti]
MKKLVLPFIIGLILIGCNSEPKGYTITGTLRGEVADSTKVIMTKIDAQRQRVDIDTALVQNGKFIFKGVADTIPVMRYLFIGQLPGYTAVILENGEITLEAQKDSLNLAKISGTLQNDSFQDYLDKSSYIQNKGQSVQADMQKAQASNDMATLTSLQDELNELQEEYKSSNLTFIKDNPNSLISALLLDGVLSSRVVSPEEVTTMYDKLSNRIKATEVGKGILTKIEAEKINAEKAKNTEVGAKAPTFSGPSPTGEQLALTDVLGKVTLIDFWAAWCRPCRAENPNIVNVYKKYHDKGLNVLGVSLDRKAEDWKKAIEDDGLTWHHISNVQYFNDPIAQLYNVQAIPAAFLLDENGVIVAKNLRGPALEQKVAELLQ